VIAPPRHPPMNPNKGPHRSLIVRSGGFQEKTVQGKKNKDEADDELDDLRIHFFEKKDTERYSRNGTDKQREYLPQFYERP